MSENNAARQSNYIHPFQGKNHSDSTKQKIAETLTGYKHTEEAKANMSKSKIGNTNCVGREPHNKGACKFSNDQIQKMKDLQAEGISYAKIAKIIGCSDWSVAKYIKT